MKASFITSNSIATNPIKSRATDPFHAKPAHPALFTRCIRPLDLLAGCALGLLLTLPAAAALPADTPATTLPASVLTPFGVAGSGDLSTAWHFSGIHAKPKTQFAVVMLEGEPVLQVSADNAYGAIANAWHSPNPAQLEWRWRVDQPLLHTDIATKAGDDAALKVCVMFDQPRSDIPLLQRAGLALARAASGQDIPNATLCYVWDSHYPAGTSGANPYSARVRYIVLDGLDAPLAHWRTQRRRVAEDFQLLFGKETPVTPPVVAVAVGADSDNTHDHSLAYLSHLH